MKIHIQYPQRELHKTPAVVSIETDDAGLSTDESLKYAEDAINLALKTVWGDKTNTVNINGSISVPRQSGKTIELGVAYLALTPANIKELADRLPKVSDVPAFKVSKTDAKTEPKDEVAEFIASASRMPISAKGATELFNNQINTVEKFLKTETDPDRIKALKGIASNAVFGLSINDHR